MYWYGVPSNERKNMATCIWETKDAAHKVVYGGKHQEAITITNDAYDSAEIQEYDISKKKGETSLAITFKTKRILIGDGASPRSA